MISDAYTAACTWCNAEYGRLTYWLGCVITYIAAPTSVQQSARKGDAHPTRKPVPTATSAAMTTTTTAPSNRMVDVPEVPSIIEIKRAIPKYCFESQLHLSLYYMTKDLVLIMMLYAGMLAVERLPYTVLYAIYLPIYCMLQGTLFWSIFVLGHECGHNSFSSYPVLNDILGNLLHTIICVPYYPWKVSHKHHHKNTGNIDRDEIFYPIRSHDTTSEGGKCKGKFLKGFGFGFGWLAYLTIGYTPRNVCHFNPFESMFISHAIGCMVSIACVATWGYALMLYWVYYGTLALLLHYAVPLFVFATWLVVVTFLHHMEAGVAWYGDEYWSNVRGQLGSVDRHYGWAHELTHNIGTHQIHHLFSKIPHYHLEEATLCFRRAFPHLICKNDDAIIPSFFRNFNLYEDEHRIANDVQMHVWKKSE